MVNTAKTNKREDIVDFSMEALAEKCKHGYRLDIDFVSQNKPTGTHSGKQQFRLVKKI